MPTGRSALLVIHGEATGTRTRAFMEAAYVSFEFLTASDPGLETTGECPPCQNLDAKGLFQFERVRVAVDNELRPCRQCASKIKVVAGIRERCFPSGAGETRRERPISPSKADHGERRNLAPFISIFVMVARHSATISCVTKERDRRRATSTTHW